MTDTPGDRMITGKQARELLDGTTEGPWHPDYRNHPMRGDFISIGRQHDDWMVSRSERTICEVTDNHTTNADLLAAAPDLAKTVAWLYGSEPSGRDADRSEWHMTHREEVVAVDGVVLDMDGREWSPNDAVEYARALLAAAEEARGTG